MIFVDIEFWIMAILLESENYKKNRNASWGGFTFPTLQVDQF